jgi:hypothetical protein
LQEVKLAASPAVEMQPPILKKAISVKRKADEIADSDEDGDELGSDDAFGLPDEELFHEAALDEGRTD